MMESKPHLQPARQLINVNNDNNNVNNDNNNYINGNSKDKEAQVYCNNISQKETQNYVALVLLGKMLRGSDKAFLVFKFILASNPNHLLAWKSLAYYEEQCQDAISKSRLLSVYMDMLKLKIDRKQVQHVIIKIAKIGFFLNDIKSIHSLLNYLDREPTVKMYVIVKHKLLEILKADILYSNDDRLTIESYVARNNLKQFLYNSIYIELGKVILKKKNIGEAFTEMTQWPLFSSNILFRNWLCKYLCTTFITYESFKDFDIEKYKDIITTGIKNSKYTDLLNSIILYDKKFYIDAFLQYTALINYDHVNVIEATHVLKSAFKFGQWSFAVILAKKFLVKAKDTGYVMKLKKFLFIAYAEQKKWDQAIETSKEIPLDSLITCEKALLAKCYIESGQNADQIIEILQKTRYYTQLQGLALMKQGNYMDAIDILQKDLDDPVNVFYIAKSYWEIGCFETSYVYLSKGLTLNDENADVQFYLSMYYLNCKNDNKLGLHYLEKAYTLNRSDINIVKHLSDLYLKVGFKFHYFVLLKCVSGHVSDQSWINFRLGVCYMERKQWDNAIEEFLKVTRINPTDVDAHENLADAFYSKGFLKCALNSYIKTMAMNANKKLYCLSRMGNIYSILNDFDLAIASYEQALQINPQYLLAVKGITDTWISFAKVQIITKHYLIARDAAQTAVNYMVRILSTRGNNAILGFWKLLGKAIIIITTLPDDFCFVDIKFGNGQDLSNLGTIYMKSNMYKLAKYCLWHGQSYLPPELVRSVGRKLSKKIFDAEESADLFRYSCAPDLGLQYAEWVNIILRYRDEFPDL